MKIKECTSALDKDTVKAEKIGKEYTTDGTGVRRRRGKARPKCDLAGRDGAGDENQLRTEVKAWRGLRRDGQTAPSAAGARR